MFKTQEGREKSRNEADKSKRKGIIKRTLNDRTKENRERKERQATSPYHV